MENGVNGFGEWAAAIEDGRVNVEALARIVLAETGIDFDDYVALQVELELRKALPDAGSEERVLVLKTGVINDVLKMLRRGDLNVDFLMPGKNGHGKRSGRLRRRRDVRLKDRARGARFNAFFHEPKRSHLVSGGSERGEALAVELEDLMRRG